jgi:hypothetical protein
VSDGNLRQLFQKHLPSVHWQGIETWSTGQGVPDMNGCWNGHEFWIENKKTEGWAVNFEMGQVAWIERRIRVGGRVFLAVRRMVPAGPRRGKAKDELWLFHGAMARAVADFGLADVEPIDKFEGGPAKWCWTTIAMILSHH